MEKWILTPRQSCDLEMLLIGAFSPLSGFLSQEEYESVVFNTRMTSGHPWPIPITLDVTQNFAEKISINDQIGLYDPDNTLLARMKITSKWRPDKKLEAQHVFGTQDIAHPGVNYLLNQAENFYLGGPLELVQLPKHYDFADLRYTPSSLKNLFKNLGWEKIVGFQTRNPLHRAHMELTLRAAKQIDGNILIHPVVGLTKPGDVDYFTRVRCYQKLMNYYPQKITLSLLPLAMRMAGPREALWHAMIRKNYGCTHFIVGRDHAGPGKDSEGKPFYSPYAAQEFVKKFEDEIGIKILPFQEMVYVNERRNYCPVNEIKPEETPLDVSGSELRNALLNDKPIPEWFSFPEVIQELQNAYLPKFKRGLTLFFTGLSGSGKTTLARALLSHLMSLGKRNISLLDGDVVRRILANELGFSKADRDLNIRRIGFVASEITKAGGIALCAAIAPYKRPRDENRKLISELGGYIEIYVSTPISTCESRDPKGLYAKARCGELKGFTGLDDPYEPPQNPEITIDTSLFSVEESVKIIVDYLSQNNYLRLKNVKQKNAVVEYEYA